MTGRQHPTNMQMPALTGLRGVAALWVVLYHWNLLHYGTGQGYHPLAVGFLGVDVFFMLSGFVMTHSRYEQFRRLKAGEYARFLAERAMRLFPTNSVVLLLYALAVLVIPSVMLDEPPQTYSGAGFVTSLFLAQSFTGIGQGSWLIPAWSVSVELIAYAALPLVLLGIRRLNAGQALLVAAGAIGVFAAVLLSHGEHDPNVIVKGGVLRCAFEFTAGAALYRTWRLGAQLPVVTSSAVMLVLLVAAFELNYAEATFLALPAFALLLLIAAQGSGAVGRALSSAPTLFLGKVSYSLYLVHWPVLIFWRHVNGFSLSPLANLTMLAAIIGVGTILHYAVEAPSHALARGLRYRVRVLPQLTDA